VALSIADDRKAVEMGGIEPPDPWMISQGPRLVIPTAYLLYHLYKQKRRQ